MMAAWEATRVSMTERRGRPSHPATEEQGEQSPLARCAIDWQRSALLGDGLYSTVG